MSLGDNIQRLRKEKNLTQAELAKKTNLSEISIRKYESGDRNPKLDATRRIAAALGVYMNELDPDWSKYSIAEYSDILEHGLPLDELGMLQDYRILNDSGKVEARKRVNELTEIPKYQKKDE